MQIETFNKISVRVDLMSDEEIQRTISSPLGHRFTTQLGPYYAWTERVADGITCDAYSLFIWMDQALLSLDWASYFRDRSITVVVVRMFQTGIAGFENNHAGVIRLCQTPRDTVKMILWAKLVTPLMLKTHGPRPLDSVNVLA